MIKLELPRFNIKLEYNDILDKNGLPGGSHIPGIRMFSDLKNKKSYQVDTRNNSISTYRGGPDVPIQTEIDQWVCKKFQEYKDSNFKFGNDLYDPTEQITVEGFFNYLHKCMRDEVLTEIIQ